MIRGVFEPIPQAERAPLLDAYARYLAERDGEPDFAHRTLSRREAATQRLERDAACFDGAFDPSLFAAQHARFDRRRPTPAEMLLLLIFVKSNANEAYAVEQVLKQVDEGYGQQQELERLVFLEESYHTRLLLSASRLFGINVTQTTPPVASVRAIVTGITKLPEALARPVTFSGEIVGILTFLRLLQTTRRICAGNGPLRDALEERLMSVLIDEVGHLSFNRLLMNPSSFVAARLILPGVGLGTHGALPEAEALGVLPLPLGEVLRFQPRDLPQEVQRQSFIA